MALEEIEKGWYQFRITFIDKEGRLEVTYYEYLINNIDGALQRRDKIKEMLKLEGVKEIKNITWKYIGGY